MGAGAIEKQKEWASEGLVPWWYGTQRGHPWEPRHSGDIAGSFENIYERNQGHPYANTLYFVYTIYKYLNMRGWSPRTEVIPSEVRLEIRGVVNRLFAEGRVTGKVLGWHER